jgi:hypothetical protein
MNESRKIKDNFNLIKTKKKMTNLRIKNVFFHGNEQKRKIALALNEEDFIGIKQNK